MDAMTEIHQDQYALSESCRRLAYSDRNLPSGAIWQIVKELGPRTLARVACTNRELQSMADASCLWREFCSERFPLRDCIGSNLSDILVPYPWKQLYQELQLGCRLVVDLTRTRVQFKAEGGLHSDAFLLEDAVYNMFYQHGWVFPVAGRSSLTIHFRVAEPSSFGYCLRLKHLSSQSASLPLVASVPSIIQVSINGQPLFQRHYVPVGDYQSEDWIVARDMLQAHQRNTIKITICEDAEAVYWLQRVELFHAMLAYPLIAPKVQKDINYHDWVAQSSMQA